jgi:hypothetical protein
LAPPLMTLLEDRSNEEYVFSSNSFRSLFLCFGFGKDFYWS